MTLEFSTYETTGKIITELRAWQIELIVRPNNIMELRVWRAAIRKNLSEPTKYSVKPMLFYLM